jgi:hypothetical protein
MTEMFDASRPHPNMEIPDDILVIPRRLILEPIDKKSNRLMCEPIFAAARRLSEDAKCTALHTDILFCITRVAMPTFATDNFDAHSMLLPP